MEEEDCLSGEFYPYHFSLNPGLSRDTDTVGDPLSEEDFRFEPIPNGYDYCQRAIAHAFNKHDHQQQNHLTRRLLDRLISSWGLTTIRAKLYHDSLENLVT